jgi:uncharacterized membrane protein
MRKNVSLSLVLIFFTIATSLVMSLFVTSVTVASGRMLLSFWIRYISSLTNGHIDPMRVLLDFKKAMSSMWEKVFLENSIIHNFFYLQ